MDAQFTAALDAYLDLIRADYPSYRGNDGPEHPGRVIAEEMAQEFRDNLTYEVGQKYIKVIAGGASRSVHSFVVMEDDAKFKRGDVLKAASWKTPARNFARGNVFTGAKPSWTGA